MKKELIADVIDDNIIGAVDSITVEVQNLISKELNFAYEQIRRDITEKYYSVANGSPTVNVETAFDFVIAEINKKVPSCSNSKRQYRSGYFQAVNDIEKIMSGLKEIWRNK